MEPEYIFGKHSVVEALKSGRAIHNIWIAEGTRHRQMADVLTIAKKNRVPMQHVPRQKLAQLAQTNHHQGVVAAVAAYEYATIDDLFKVAVKRQEMPFFLLLDELEDPHNLGSILRTADATGVHGVIIPKRRAVGLTQAVARASTGAIEYVPVARITNMARTIDELKERGLWFVGTDADAKDDYRTTDFDMPVGLVIGSEGKGISRLIKEKCDFLTRIPMVGHVSSLNASVAASILMYEVYRRRDKGFG